MAMGKYAKVDARKSASNYCSTVTIFVFVALCLVGVWMMTSTSVVPVESSENSQPNSNEMSDQKKANVNKESEKKNSRQYEDNPGDLPDDATKGDSNTKTPREENSSGNQEKKSTDSEDESNSETERGENNEGDDSGIKKSTDTEGIQKKTEENSNGADDEYKTESLKEEKEKPKNTDSQQNSGEKKEVYPSGAQSELLKETNTQKSSWSTQALESSNEKEVQHQSESKEQVAIGWKVCNATAGPDYIPCLDNLQAVRKLRSTKHYEHRERHCPADPAKCLVPLPNGYKNPVEWPKSREKVWYNNVPHTELAQVKGHQNWVKVSGEYLTFPGGGTQFIYGALHYIDFIEKCVPEIAWGKHSRVVLDVGCGVASFGGFLFDKGVITMSLAPKDEHEAQVQFALERGIPAISAVMGTKRLPFPGRVFDVVHCARCRVPWHIEGGKLLLELNRVLRPGGHFVWSATPVYLKEDEDVEIWNAMTELTKSMCWELVSKEKDVVDMVGVAIFRKPISNDCYEKRSVDHPPICHKSDDPNAAWYVPLQACLHKVPEDASERGSQWPEQWPARLDAPPYWLLKSQVGVYGKPAPEDFAEDYEHWKNVVTKSYLTGIGINWSTVRNVMDMRSIYGGFAAALRDLQIWVMNVVPVDSPDTLPIIYERGLFGIYHDWCESFSTYPRTYDLLHADHIFSKTKKRCDIVNIVVEVDRILRPEGKLIVRDNVETISEIEKLVKSMNWEVRLTFSKEKEGLLCVQKTRWRPDQVEIVAYAI